VQRTGWVLRGIERPESVAEHSYRMAMMALLFAGDRDVDASRASCMALVHDLAEAIVGDIAPSQGVSPENKMRLEREAMQSIVQTLGDNPAARLISGLWEEYEARLTPEARLVKDLDRLEMVLQADEYETAHGLDLSEFFHSVAGKIRHPAVAAWFDALEKKRKV
jgi:putative hydrolase of HD superfamily